jgi:hypothetical protein
LRESAESGAYAHSQACSIGQLHTRIYLRWRVRMCSAQDRTTRVVEQHAFAAAGSQIESLDLLCSGFSLNKQHRGDSRFPQVGVGAAARGAFLELSGDRPPQFIRS